MLSTHPRSPKMKAVVLTLAVLSLTGGQARHTLQQDDAQSRWGRVKEEASMYVDILKEGGKEFMSRIEAWELAKKMNLTIQENLDTLGANITKLHDQLSQMVTQEYWNSLLTQDMNKDLEQAKERVTFYLQQLREKLGSKMREGMSKSVGRLLEQYGDQMPKGLATQLQALKDGDLSLGKLRVQVGEKLKGLRVQLQKLYNASPEKWLEDLHVGIQPVWEKLLLFPEEARQWWASQ